MARLQVFVCDKCADRKEKIGASLPSGWVEAVVTTDDYGGEQEIHRMWCSSCWRRINSEVPEKVAASVATPPNSEDIPF